MLDGSGAHDGGERARNRLGRGAACVRVGGRRRAVWLERARRLRLPGGRAVIGQLVRTVAEGYVAPRRSIRRLLDTGNGLEAALLMLALAYVVQAILTVLFISAGVGIGGHLLAIVQQLVVFFVLSALIYGVGRMAGGTGTLEGAQLVVGWHALVVSVISPLAIGVSSVAFRPEAEEGAGLPAGLGFLAFLYVAISFWLMANFIAELHGFRSNWGVLGTIVGLTFACAILLASIVGAVAPA